MTAEELRVKLNATPWPWPNPYPVDQATYEAVEDWLLADRKARGLDPILWCGPNGGVMFKGVELSCGTV